MAKQYGNSGRGTEAPAPRADGDQDESDQPLPTHEERRNVSGTSNDEFHGRHDRGQPDGGEEQEPARQPGGAAHSESEKPSTPNSRWGGGHGPG